MKERLDFKTASPAAFLAMLGIENHVRSCGLDHALLELVKTRVSQINGCAFCLDMHTREARAAAETEQRLYLLPAWRETPLYTARELEHLERAAWLHDLGRFIAPEIDVTTDRSDDHALELSTARWARQVDIAVSIIETVPVLGPAAALVKASRECIDGSGYPRGLRGGEIPLGARVLHVADTFDALSSVCASLGVGQDAVPAELLRNSGSRFDPAVVAACLRALDTPPIAAQGL